MLPTAARARNASSRTASVQRRGGRRAATTKGPFFGHATRARRLAPSDPSTGVAAGRGGRRRRCPYPSAGSARLLPGRVFVGHGRGGSVRSGPRGGGTDRLPEPTPTGPGVGSGRTG